jgi:hypothetical protein
MVEEIKETPRQKKKTAEEQKTEQHPAAAEEFKDLNIKAKASDSEDES